MRNLLGYLTKHQSRYNRSLFLFLTVAIFLSGYLYPLSNSYSSKVFAEEETRTTSEAVIDYKVEKDGDLKVGITISLSNITDIPLPIKLFETSIPFPNASEIAAKYSNEYLYVTSSARKEHTDISMNLENRILRRNSPMTVNLTFTIKDYYNAGEPVLTLPSGFSYSDVKKVNLLYPKEFGQPTSVEPADHTSKETDENYWLSFKEMKGVDIYLLLNDQLVYRYNQKNQLINSDSVEKVFDIVLPPNGTTQTVLLTTVEPKPDATQIDSEGNVIMQYIVGPTETLDVVTGGFISKHPRIQESISNGLNPHYSEPSGYWMIDESDITKVESKIGEISETNWSDLKKSEREKLLLSINKYVVDSLDETEYDSESIQFRRGAAESFSGYDAASPQDYVDLTIALLRTYRIPSRQVVGYSTNLQDLFKSSSTHTWVQYWDPENGWSSYDTYQDEILGTNRINIASADRVVLMYRGLDPIFPQFTSHSIEYLTIKLSDDKVTPTTNLVLGSEDISWSITDTMIDIPISIKNDGSTMLESLSIVAPSGELIDLIDKVILPGQEINITLPMSITDVQRIMEGNDNELSFGVEAQSTLGTSTFSLISVQNSSSEPWWWAPMISLLSLTIFLLTIIVIVYSYKFIKNKVK